MCGVLDGGTPPDPRPVRPVPKEIAMMQHQMIEWGPAHLREDAPPIELELADRPDDN
jgi:hypothetical protein